MIGFWRHSVKSVPASGIVGTSMDDMIVVGKIVGDVVITVIANGNRRRRL
ncbi:MAG: hypothetical protein R3E01_32305 [Pirellulaceae bacterium]|nr:hypothetical protein [Planctomycetales bacterium]